MKPDRSATSINALEQITRAEVDIQISTAQRFPRDEQASIRKAEAMALVDDETAAECYYAIPRAGKTIVGPSIRLAEIIATTWKNLRVASRVMDIGQDDLTVAAVCHDLENNVAVSSEVRRRIKDKNNRRYSDDMIAVTANAAASIALRNAVFKVVPRALWWRILNKAMSRNTGGRGELEASVQKALQWFSGYGVSKEQILSKLNRKAIGEITSQDLATLRGMSTAIKEETASVIDLFELEGPPLKKSGSLTEPREPGSDG